MSTPRPAKAAEVPKYDTRKEPNGQAALVGSVRVPFTLTNLLRWVKRGERYVLQQKWSRTVTSGTLALKRDKGPTVVEVWIDVPQGEE